jgi:superfamily II DNA or RNA helicase
LRQKGFLLAWQTAQRREMTETEGVGPGQEPTPKIEHANNDACSISEFAHPLQAASPPQLRQYQVEAIQQCRQQLAIGKNKICLVAPTGSGKTIIAGEIIRLTEARDKRVLVLAHTREIIGQTSGKLRSFDIPHGILAAELTRGAYHHVQVASVQTYWSRVVRRKCMERPPADLIIIDECHHVRARTWREIIQSYPGVPLIGLTATPCRGDGRGLGEVFDTLVECPQVPDLIRLGHLVPTKTYAPPPPDLRGIKMQAGDYVVDQLGERMNDDGLIGDILTNCFKRAEGLKTICFAVNVAHSQHIAAEFVRAGIAAEHVDGSTPTQQRDHILKRLASGMTTVVSNCMVLTEGFDLPDLECMVLARPTRQMGLYRQMVGRGVRPADGKQHLVVLDHSGAIYTHGPVEDIVEWTLYRDRRAVNKHHDNRQRRDTDGSYHSRIIDCRGCGAKRITGHDCMHCGYFPQKPPQAIVFDDADLVLYDAVSRRSHASDYTAEEIAEWHGMLAWIERERGYKSGWVGFKFKEKFGDWPPPLYPKLIKPNQEVLAWIRSRNVAFAKAQRRGAA